MPIPLGATQIEDRTTRLMRAIYSGVGRFQRIRSLHQFKEKFGPRWEDRYLAIPNSLVLPEVLIALARAHLPALLAGRLALGRWTAATEEKSHRPFDTSAA